MARKGKRISGAYEGIDRDASYELDAAVKMLKDNAKAKFDETIELSAPMIWRRRSSRARSISIA